MEGANLPNTLVSGVWAQGGCCVEIHQGPQGGSLKLISPGGTCSWGECQVVAKEPGRRRAGGRQCGYLRVYPGLPLWGVGATGLAGALCPRGNTPPLQQGERDTHKQHQESRGWGEREEEWREEREQRGVIFVAMPSASADTGLEAPD